MQPKIFFVRGEVLILMRNLNKYWTIVTNERRDVYIRCRRFYLRF